MDEANFPLPLLHPLVTLSRAPQKEGDPVWTLHHPVSNQYFQIDWLTYECLTRFMHFKTVNELIDSVNKDTTLFVTQEQIKDIIRFLHRHHLLDERLYEKNKETKKINPLFLLLKNYLFFTVPILRPQRFLSKTYPYMSWLFTEGVVKGFLLFLLIMIVYTLPRLDEFLQSFSRILSLEGIIQIGITFFCIKIIHEFAHAFAATRYGVAVPRMGIAFMVLYPILYTEASAAWQLSSRRHRFHIAVAGIVAELCLAGLFLLIWNMSPAGSLLQSISFLVVTVSLVGSLLINLNPLMRFDGYYIISDLLGYDNLQQRACNFARWRLRRILFDISQQKPEAIDQQRERFLTLFGFALITYRFFLFLGIAILVYHVFFQPLGLFLMLVEIGYFIILPLFLEIREWWKLRHKILAKRRGKITFAVIGILLLYCILPVQSYVRAPAILHASEYQNFYAPAPAQITDVFVRDGDVVTKGQVLMRLSSADIQRRIELTQAELDKLRQYQQRNVLLQTESSSFVTSEMVKQAEIKLEGLRTQKNNLVLTAGFEGVVKDMDMSLSRGQFVKSNARLLTIINPHSFNVTAYISQSERDRLKLENEGDFIPYAYFKSYPVMVEKISPTATSNITWRELSSVYAGPIASDHDTSGKSVYPIARQRFYQVDLRLMTPSVDKNLHAVQKGWVKIRGSRSSILSMNTNKLLNILRQENLLP
jgi:putative peptide zinc metalloprotease protein